MYNRMVGQAGSRALPRDVVIEAGNHVDQLADVFPDVTRSVLPCCARDVRDALDCWVEPPPGGTVPRPGYPANSCALAGQR